MRIIERVTKRYHFVQKEVQRTSTTTKLENELVKEHMQLYELGQNEKLEKRLQSKYMTS